ncbi:hypothetical protein DPEC_G00336160 [Dallia pectoralis]|uniref:Uncharacterized protein n=1 Tax=Dallia pectoralis TaxID=75939 RepID=A0ACC2F722_DALPE|nr:hypothetical protein DPEC_G00336160 [Dallia pectoralis]
MRRGDRFRRHPDHSHTHTKWRQLPTSVPMPRQVLNKDMALMRPSPLRLAMDKALSQLMANSRVMGHTASRPTPPMPRAAALPVDTHNRATHRHTVNSRQLQLGTLLLLQQLLLPPHQVTASQLRGMELEGTLLPPPLPPAPARALMGSRVPMQPSRHTRVMGNSQLLGRHQATAPVASHPPAMSRTPTPRRPSRLRTPRLRLVVATRANRVVTANRVADTRLLLPRHRPRPPVILPRQEALTVNHRPASMVHRAGQEGAMVSRVITKLPASTAATDRIIPTAVAATLGRSPVDTGAMVMAKAWGERAEARPWGV